MKRIRSILTSVRGKSLVGFVIIILLVLIMVIGSSYQLTQVQAASAKVVPSTEQIESTQEFALSMSSLEANLNRFFVTEGADFEENIRTELSYMNDILDTLQEQPVETTADAIVALSLSTNTLETSILAYLDADRSTWSPNDLNRALINLYQQIDEVNQLQQQLSTETLDHLQDVATVQQAIINNINTQFIVLGTAVFLIAIGAAFVISRTLRPIGTLTEVALDFADGNLEREAPVESNDEIGTLAQAFNSMTRQLRDMVDNLEQRVADRTRDLELANEVGRTVSEIRDSNQLLSDAVTIIRDEFDLYLAQIYLIEEDQETLLLHAAAGQAANRLLAQGHFLAVNTASINGTAVSEKRAVVVSNTTQDPLFRPNPLLPDTRSEMAVPLLVADRAIGVLDIQSSVANSFTEENVPAFTAMAGQLAIALENASLFSEREASTQALQEALSGVEMQAERFRVLNQLGAGLTTAQSLDEVYQITGAQILDIIEGDRASLALLTPDSRSFEMLVLTGAEEGFKTGVIMPLADTAVNEAVQNNRIVRLPKDMPLAAYKDSNNMAQQGMHSALLAPLVVSGQVIGTMNIGSKRPFTYTDADMNFIQQTATLLASTIDSLRLIERIQRLAGIVENHPDFIGVGTLAGEALYVNPAGLALMGRPADHDVTSMSATDFYLPEDAERLQQEGIPAALAAGSWTAEVHLSRTDGTTIPVEQTVAINYDSEKNPTSFSITMRDITERQQAAESQRRLTTQLEERLLQVNAMQRAMTHEGWSAFLTSPNRLVQGFKFNDDQIGFISSQDVQNGAVPVLTEPDSLAQPDPAATVAAVQVRGETVGVIGARSPDGDPLNEDQVAILHALTQQVADALDRARLFEEMELAREQMNALYSGSERVVRAQSIDDVLLALVESTELKRMDSANFLFFNKPWHEAPPETMSITAVWEKRRDSTPEKVGDLFEIAQFPTLQNISKEEPTLFYDVRTDERAGPDAKMLAEQLGMTCVMYFPLIVGDQWFGLLSAKAADAIRFSNDEIKQITGLVDQAASVSQTQRLFEQAQSRARREQLLREVTAKVYAAADAEAILKTAATEVNRIMGVDSFVYLHSVGNDEQKQPEKSITKRNGGIS